MERELWEQLYAIVVPLDRFWTNGFYRSWEIVLIFLWAVVHDRPTSWACQSRNWIPAPPCHGLPSQSTMSRRLRTPAVEQLLHAIEAQLGGDARRRWLQRIDSKPLPIGWNSHDPDARYGVPLVVLPRDINCMPSGEVVDCLPRGGLSRWE